ncbi:uncharacterized protein LOC120746864 isoform X2 [Simochromis diagramma]|uniref:uncharacterized protein LOC120746864 isoform X2 n=1 Tax=Simochromis diagramma TaxID=43689 RepID=UPI001A7ED2FC|nr:uncharacterized protein LOC120746864 isoform X2 [Simochromis diagramma]
MDINMLLLFLLLLLFGSQANHFFGTVMTFTPKDKMHNGSVTVVFHYKLSFRSCTDQDTWSCVSGDCGTESVELSIVDEEDKEWCQREGVMSREVSSNAVFQLRLDGGDWIQTKNKVKKWRALTNVDLRTRLDTNQPNKSPQTTILPALRVPSNCQRVFTLSAFDPDGDKVKCRFGDIDADECNPCTPPSVLTISQTNITPSEALSKIPIRFALMVDPPAPSCSEGVYLPRFLPPTPANGARMYTNDTVNITIMAEVTNTMVLKLLFSGPHNVVKHNESHGEFILTWTPSENQDGEDHPVCFLVQAQKGAAKYQSELRCVIVSYRTEPVITTSMPTTVLPSTTPASTTTVMETETLSISTMVADESKASGDDSSRAGKIAGAVCGAVGVAATVGIVVWVVRGSPHAFYKVV